MSIWEADFYRRPLTNEAGQPLWELLLCDRASDFRYQAFCPQSQASADWVRIQLQQATAASSIPETICVFRSQTLALMEPAAKTLGIEVQATRRTPTLKRWLEERSREYPTLADYAPQPYRPLDLDKPPPLPLPENLWGDRWRFAALPAGELVEAFTGRMIPIVDLPEALLPLNQGLASTLPIPGVVIDAGRRSRQLTQWLQQARPVSLSYGAGAPDGLVLEAGLVDRWIVATFDDAEVRAAAQQYAQRQQCSQGLHFLLVQPDDTGITYSGVWLLQLEAG